MRALLKCIQIIGRSSCEFLALASALIQVHFAGAEYNEIGITIAHRILPLYFVRGKTAATITGNKRCSQRMSLLCIRPDVPVVVAISKRRSEIAAAIGSKIYQEGRATLAGFKTVHSDDFTGIR